MNFGFRFWISIGRSQSKKVFCLALGAMLLALSVPTDAQQAKKVYRIGYLTAGSKITPTEEAFRQELGELGRRKKKVSGTLLVFAAISD